MQETFNNEYLPYKSFEKNISNKLPDNWKLVKLSKLLLSKPQYGMSIKANKDKSGIPILRMGNIQDGKLDLSDLKYVNIDNETLNKFSLEKGDLIFNRTNSLELVGKTAIFDENENFIFASYLIRLKVNSDLINAKYLNYYINMNKTQVWLKKRARQATNQANINAQKLQTLLVPLPPLKIQNQIVHKIENAFSNIDQLEELRYDALDKTDMLFESILNEILENGKKSKNWQKVKLKDLGQYVNGRAFKPAEWEEKGLPIIRIQNLNKPKAPYNYYSKPVEEKYYIKNGDVLISWSATLDAFIWDRGDALLNQHIFKVELEKDKITKSFFFYLLKHVLHEIKAKTHGSTMKHITKGKFENFEVHIPYKNGKPDINKQNKISGYLDNLKKEIMRINELQEIQIERFLQLKESILNMAFIGQL